MGRALFLMHHGILGQKWGVRRFQNPDGTLTAAGRKRYMSEVRDSVNKANRDLNKREERRQWEAYNRTADIMNNGMLDNLNKQYDKALGKAAKNHDYGNDDDYNDMIRNAFNDVFENELQKLKVSEIKNNANFKKAVDLVKKYELEKVDDFAKDVLDIYNGINDSTDEKSTSNKSSKTKELAEAKTESSSGTTFTPKKVGNYTTVDSDNPKSWKQTGGKLSDDEVKATKEVAKTFNDIASDLVKSEDTKNMKAADNAFFKAYDKITEAAENNGFEINRFSKNNSDDSLIVNMYNSDTSRSINMTFDKNGLSVSSENY